MQFGNIYIKNPQDVITVAPLAGNVTRTGSPSCSIAIKVPCAQELTHITADAESALALLEYLKRINLTKSTANTVVDSLREAEAAVSQAISTIS